MTSYQTRDVIVKVADYIESLPDGNRTTTNRILKQLFDKDAFEMDAFIIHGEVFDEIEKRGRVILDMSEHFGMLQGLPENLDYVIRRKG